MSTLPFKPNLQKSVKPKGLFELDKTNKLAPDELCVDLGSRNIDFVSGRTLTTSSAIETNIVGCAETRHFDGATQERYLLPKKMESHGNVSKWTLTFKARRTGNTNDGVLLGVADTSTDYIWLKDGLFTVNAIGSQVSVSLGAVDSSEMHTYTVQFDGTAYYRLFIDGVYRATSSYSEQSSSLEISHIGACYTSASYAYEGDFEFLYVHSWTLNDTEIKSLHSDPYQIYKPIRSIYFVPDSAENISVEIPNHNLTLTSYAPSINISGNANTEIPVHNLQLSSFAPSVNVSDHKIIAIPDHDIIITSYGPTTSVSDNKQITVPANDLILTSYAPSVSVSDTIAIEIPVKNISLTSFAPSISIGDHISLVIPNNNLSLNSFSPAVSVTASIDVVIPNADISLTSFSPSVFASDNKSLEISNHDISLISFAPSVSIGDAVSLDILNRDIVISSFAPSVSIGNNISVNIPAHNLNLQSYPPSVVVSSFVDLTIQNTDINLTSYAPLVTIAGAFSTAPERIYTVPAVKRNFVYPAINRIYTMPKK